jgi:hypothetical protein
LFGNPIAGPDKDRTNSVRRDAENRMDAPLLPSEARTQFGAIPANHATSLCMHIPADAAHAVRTTFKASLNKSRFVIPHAGQKRKSH